MVDSTTPIETTWHTHIAQIGVHYECMSHWQLVQMCSYRLLARLDTSMANFCYALILVPVLIYSAFHSCMHVKITDDTTYRDDWDVMHLETN